ncbi:MAG: alpha/beta fold hydrolase [Lysobacter sp.]|nr:alpha/beta fold hydrolase [Lysobacter sp.]
MTSIPHAAPLRELDLPTARGRFAGLRNGNAGAPPLLALHGWLDNAASFVPMAPFLAGYDLVALDLPGHGQSFHYPVDAEYSLFSTLLDVLAAADALGWTRFTLLGHSMGGAIASLLAPAAPERIERLRLIEAIGPLAAPEDTTAERLRDAVAKRRALDGKRKRVFDDPELAVRARMQTNITSLDEASARLLVGRGLNTVDGGYEWSSDTRLTLPTAVRMSEAQVADCLRAITCPVRMVMADPAPPYIPASMRDGRIACVRDIACTVLPGSHHLHMTHPREVVAALGL